MNDWYLRVGTFRGAPLRLHWTVPIGMLVMTRLRFAPGEWIGFVIVVLVHELGHALLVDRFGLPLVAVDVHGFGGRCVYAGHPSSRQRAIIAWGGVAAQAALLAVASTALLVIGWPSVGFLGELGEALTTDNLFLLALNLLPIPPLDGAEAWKLLRRR